MKHLFYIALSFIISFQAWSQCPDGLMRFESPECNNPENAKIKEASCNSLIVEWIGSPNQTYEVEAFLNLPSSKELVKAEVGKIGCSPIGNCNANIEITQGAFVTWNVVAKCNENGAIIYGDKVEGEPALIPKCNQNKNLASLNVYPNPSNGKITVEILSYKSGRLNIFIYNSTGSVRAATELEVTAGVTLTKQFDFSNYAHGLYFIVAQNDDEGLEQRFLIE